MSAGIQNIDKLHTKCKDWGNEIFFLKTSNIQNIWNKKSFNRCDR